MKTTHILIAAGVAVAAYVVYRKATTPTPQPTTTVGGQVGTAVDLGKKAVESVLSIFSAPGSKTAPAPTTEAVAPLGTGAINFDADGDTSGQYATGVIPLRAFA